MTARKIFGFPVKVLVFMPLFIVILLFTFPLGYANDFSVISKNDSINNMQWVDSVFNTMSADERLGQLFMVEISSKWKPTDQNYINIENYIKNQHIGGLIFFYGGPVRQADMINRLQKISKIPMMIAQDGEWGLGMRLDSTVSFPRQLMLGAVTDNELVYQVGLEIGRQCNRVGVNIDFSPVVDLYNNAGNSVITNRSFGSDKKNVAEKAFAMMSGMQDCNVLTTAKHFPGHGNTQTDSHKALPIITDSRQNLENYEYYPFKYLINNGIRGVLVGHLFVPSLDNADNIPSSLSNKIITGELIEKLKFNGLIFTDALAMKGVSAAYSAGEVELKALQAGVDVFLMPTDCKKAFETIKNALNQGVVTQERIDHSCKKILYAKKQMGLDKFMKINTENLYNDLNNENSAALIKKISENAVTLIQNTDSILPIKNIADKKIAAVCVGNSGTLTNFENRLKNYAEISFFSISKNASKTEFDNLLSQLKNFDVVILALHNGNPYPPRFGFPDLLTDFADNLANQNNTILNIFNSPMSFNRFKNQQKFKAVAISYEDGATVQDVSAQLIFGGLEYRGKLPVKINENYVEDLGIETSKIRLGYVAPEYVNANEKYLCQLDSLIFNAIQQHAFPGCQVLAAVDGNIFYNRNFGNFTYSDNRAVTSNDIYDLASVTKVAATTPALMKLFDEGKFSPSKTLGAQLPLAKGTNKSSLLCRDILLHQARLQPWVSVCKNAYSKANGLNPDVISDFRDSVYNLPFSNDKFITEHFRDSVKRSILNSKLYNSKRYVYSDIGFYLMQYLVEYQANTTIDKYVEQEFYKRLGAKTLGYNPTKKYSKKQIAPTENDVNFCRGQVQGYVQDFGAALQGGVAGHSGLFSNADDIAKLMQMYANGGEYGGERFIKKSTLKYFTNRQCQTNRRGLGFDKNTIDGTKGPATKLASSESFGHTGFAGTFVWADPKYNIVFVFLSNRVYPDAKNNLIKTLGIRKRAQSLVYKAVLEPENTQNYISK